MFFDRDVAIQIAAHPILDERTKNIDIDCHFEGENFGRSNTNTTY